MDIIFNATQSSRCMHAHMAHPSLEQVIFITISVLDSDGKNLINSCIAFILMAVDTWRFHSPRCVHSRNGWCVLMKMQQIAMKGLPWRVLSMYLLFFLDCFWRLVCLGCCGKLSSAIYFVRCYISCNIDLYIRLCYTGILLHTLFLPTEWYLKCSFIGINKGEA